MTDLRFTFEVSAYYPNGYVSDVPFLTEDSARVVFERYKASAAKGEKMPHPAKVELKDLTTREIVEVWTNDE